MSKLYFQRFASLENAPSKVRITSVLDKKRQLSYERLRDFSRLLRAGKIDEEAIKNQIARLVLDLRNLAGNREYLSEHWKKNSEDFQKISSFVKSYADDDTNKSLQKLIDSLISLADDDDSTYSTGLSEVASLGEVDLIVVPKSWQVFQIEGFLEEIHQGHILVLHESSFFSSTNSKAKRILFLTAPNRMREHHLRNLFFGGAAVAFEFFSPSWQLDKNPNRIISRLFPQNMTFRQITFEILGDTSDSQVDEDEIDLISTAASLENVPQFNASGDVDCRLIELSGSYVYPVELSASRVSVLVENIDGAIQVDYLDPFEELSPGDIVFELKTGADEDFLLESLQSDSGQDYKEFKKIHSRWKNELRAKLHHDSFEEIERNLTYLGVKAASQLRFWIENPDFISPRLNEDWKKLLEFSGFNKEELSRALELTKLIRAKLIHFGLSARKMMAEEISSQELDRVSQGEVLLKSLPDFGDAVFAIATVTNVTSEIFRCQQSDIRTLMRKSND